MSNGLNKSKSKTNVVDIKAEYVRLREQDARDVFETLMSGLQEKKCRISLYAEIGDTKIPINQLIAFTVSWSIEPQD